MENGFTTVYDEETNMASVVDVTPHGKFRVRLFDVDAERFVPGHEIHYPASMEARAWEKAFSIALP